MHFTVQEVSQSGIGRTRRDECRTDMKSKRLLGESRLQFGRQVVQAASRWENAAQAGGKARAGVMLLSSSLSS